MRSVALIAAVLVAGCEAELPAPDVPDAPDVEEDGCHVSEGKINIHASMDTLVLDYGAVAIWVYEQDSVIWVEDFPQDGDLALRSFTIHRLGFPHSFDLCLQPGRYLVRGILDMNHNGWVCDPGELWGSVEYVHPAATEADLTFTLDQVIAESDGCLGEQTIPQDDPPQE